MLSNNNLLILLVYNAVLWLCIQQTNKISALIMDRFKIVNFVQRLIIVLWSYFFMVKAAFEFFIDLL
jgi:hypothetical protein